MILYEKICYNNLIGEYLNENKRIAINFIDTHARKL
jgi:hypothetical protein